MEGEASAEASSSRLCPISFNHATSRSSSSRAASSSPRLLSPPSSPPPTLALNGLPISAPTSSAYPPPSPAKRRAMAAAQQARQRRGAGPSSPTRGGRTTSSTISGKRPPTEQDATLKVPGSSSSRNASERSAALRRRQRQIKQGNKNSMPNPFFRPLEAVGWLRWRVSVFMQGTFSLGMLTDWETWLLAFVTFLLASVILYSLLFQFPKTVQALIKRTSYYLHGSTHGFSTNGGDAAETLLAAGKDGIGSAKVVFRDEAIQGS